MTHHPLSIWLSRLAARLTPRTILWLGVGLFVLSAGTHVVLGQPNSDEGFYLYASQRVWQGALPYRDFAYVQMPALPYFYGLPITLFGPSLYVGRLTSVALALAQLAAALALARRYAGLKAAAVTAVLLGSFTFVIYFHTIVKTYALVSLLFTLAFLAMPRGAGSLWRWALAIACATLAAQVRLSAVAFWLPLLLYGLWTVRGGLAARVALGAWAALLWVPALYLFSLQPAAAQWGLLTIHFEQWQSPSLARRLAEIIAFRVPSIATGFAPHLSLVAVTAVAYGHDRRPARRMTEPLLMLLSLGLFAAAHLVTGEWHLEYLVPAAAAATPLLAVGVARVWERAASAPLRAMWASLLAVALGAALVQNFPAHLVLNPAYAPVAVIRAAAQVVAGQSNPEDRVLALEALGVALEARRDLLPGLGLGNTTVQIMPNAEAEALGVVTPDMVAADLEAHAAQIVLFTRRDREELVAWGVDARVQAALDAHYQLVSAVPRFGQYSDTLSIYACRSCR